MQGEQDEIDPLTLALIPVLLAGQVQAAPTTLGKGEGQLNIVAWAGYVERGETDKNYDWVTGFEKETGCKVNVKTAATRRDGGADERGRLRSVTASGDASLRLIAGGKVQALNLALIPSYGKIDPRLQNAPGTR
jgi:putative spermidine/putrescine transport system substrate-binding protein